MNLRTYQAYTMGEVLAKIREDLGEDAVILHTRSFKRGGVFGVGAQTIVEVTASTAAHVARVRDSKPSAKTASAATVGSSQPAAAGAASRIAASGVARRPLHLNETDRNEQTSPSSAPSDNEAAAQRARIESLLQTTREIAERRAAIRPASADHRPPAAQESDPVPPTPAPIVERPRPKSESRVARRFVVDSNTGEIRADRRGSAPHAPVNRTTPRDEASPPPAATAAPMDPPAADPQLATELTALRRMVGQVLQRQSGTLQPSMPDELFKMYLSLIEHDVAEELADDVCGRVRDELSPENLKDHDQVRASILRHLSGHITVADDASNEGRGADGRPVTIALIGPTGVGKTTTVAKLAATYKLRHHRRVGLITTDTYRIAAVDQLRTYANIIGVPLKVALTTEEMAAACHEFREFDVILIDTAGRSPNDNDRIAEIRAFLDAAAPHETHLVLSSTSSESTLMRIVESFAPANADRVIFTKLDEAVNFGVLVNVMRRVNKRLSFVTTGQEVPDHIEPGQSERLARLVLGEKLSE